MDWRVWDDMRKVLNREGPRGYVYRDLLSSFRQGLYVKLICLRRTQEQLNTSRTIGAFSTPGNRSIASDNDSEVHVRQWKQLNDNLEEIIQHIDIRLRNAEVSLQTLLANTQLEESRKAIQQGETVKRLTILAFIYVPVSCVSSVFGMNVRLSLQVQIQLLRISQVRELINPNPSIWIYFVVTLSVTTLTILASLQRVRTFVYELWLPLGPRVRRLYLSKRRLWRALRWKINNTRQKAAPAHRDGESNHSIELSQH